MAFLINSFEGYYFLCLLLLLEYPLIFFSLPTDFFKIDIIQKLQMLCQLEQLYVYVLEALYSIEEDVEQV